MFCRQCGKPMSEGDGFCQSCGTAVHTDTPAQGMPVTPVPPTYQTPVQQIFVGGASSSSSSSSSSSAAAAAAVSGIARGISPKSRLVASLLAILLGYFGIHRFYLGKVGTGILMLLTGGGFLIWWVIDSIVAVSGGLTDSEGRVVSRW